MKANSIELAPLVILALDPLPAERREEVLAEVYRLVEDPSNRTPVVKVDPSRRWYRVDIPGGLRAFFRTDEEDHVVEIVDLYRPSAFLTEAEQAESVTTSP